MALTVTLTPVWGEEEARPFFVLYLDSLTYNIGGMPLGLPLSGTKFVHTSLHIVGRVLVM